MAVTHSSASGISSGASTVAANPLKIVSSDVTDANTGSKVVISDLQQAIAAGKQYSCTYYLYSISDAVPVLKFWPTYPTGCTYTIAGSGEWAPSNSYQPSKADAADAQIAQFTGDNAASYKLFVLTVDLKSGASAGNLNMRFTSGAGTYGKILQGSWCELREVVAA